jgi:hypothetical protein
MVLQCAVQFRRQQPLRSGSSLRQSIRLVRGRFGHRDTSAVRCHTQA